MLPTNLAVYMWHFLLTNQLCNDTCNSLSVHFLILAALRSLPALRAQYKIAERSRSLNSARTVQERQSR